MYFNSLEFCLFFAVVYGLYFVFRLRSQNVLLLIASYVFYGWWDWRFLGLIILSTVIDYFCGRNIESAKSQRGQRLWLLFRVAANLGILGFFKYYNFFVANIGRVLGPLGLSMDIGIASIVLPVGISFYTFQTMSYTIDIYREWILDFRHMESLTNEDFSDWTHLSVSGAQKLSSELNSILREVSP